MPGVVSSPRGPATFLVAEARSPFVALELGGLSFTREGEDLVTRSKDPRLALRVDETTSFSQRITGGLGEALRAIFCTRGDSRTGLPGLLGSWSGTFPTVRCTFAIGESGNEQVSLSGYLEPARDGKGVVISNPTGESFSGLPHVAPTVGELAKLQRLPHRLLEATFLASVPVRGSGVAAENLEIPLTVIDRASSPSQSDGFEALRDLKGKYVRVFYTPKPDPNYPNEVDEPRSLCGLVKEVDGKGSVSIARISGKLVSIDPGRHEIHQIDQVRIPARYEYERHGNFVEVLDEQRYIEDRFSRGTPIQVAFSERMNESRSTTSRVETATLQGTFWQFVEHPTAGKFVVLRSDAGALCAVAMRDLRYLQTAGMRGVSGWDDRYEVFTEPRGGNSQSVAMVTWGRSGEKEMPCEAVWGHTYQGQGWMRPESIS